MTTLTEAMRSRMSRREFGQPETRGYPMNDPVHMRLAISGASRAEHAGNISESEKERIQAMARERLKRAMMKAAGHGT